MQRIVVLTGAGVSAESGLSTFRGGGGLWDDHRVEDVATPEAFARDPALVHRFYNERRRKAGAARPNAAHHALAELAARDDIHLTLVTQNVDGLHEAAGARDVIHMHGALADALCAACGHRWPAPKVMAAEDPCPDCAMRATRPDIVWFGEIPYHMERIAEALERADIFASIGTSGRVYPAAGFVDHAAARGVTCHGFNLDADEIGPVFDHHHVGPATQTVPAWVATLTS
ncbi:Sir2 family NAD-dependent protein deacetylase [Pseudaestuariivita atlantica]|uniref:NAD-dependent protein deacylase n=1 Tax=Pseudaestuariivita atlantica TaxID=1317121 RepID=A0A0L1JTS4_9RHOB|nr:Sir2 family NAD-dependent protein deacetylase [Pseudaestuariivita atlantica]KNG95174.1 NAD-dependent deacetylase [Pseudaestuariivita atlantica]